MAKRKKISEPELAYKLVSSTELEIAEMQLERLKYIAIERLLTPDETKQYDLLVKNVMLIRGQPTSISGTAYLVEDMEESELVELASTPLEITDETEESEKVSEDVNKSRAT